MLYADPGSGVLIWQLAVAVLFGVTFYFSRLRNWATAKLKLAKSKPETDNHDHNHLDE